MMRPRSTLRYTEVIEEIADDFIANRVRKIRDPSTNRLPKNFLDEMYKWGLESVACLALNVRLGERR